MGTAAYTKAAGRGGWRGEDIEDDGDCDEERFGEASGGVEGKEQVRLEFDSDLAFLLLGNF